MNERVRGIEPPCAAWEAAVLPLNYTREEIFDFRFAIADCNRNKMHTGVAASLPRNYIVCRGTSVLVGRWTRHAARLTVRPKGPGDYAYCKRCGPGIQTIRIG